VSPAGEETGARWRLPAALMVVLAGLFAGIAAVIFQDNLTRFSINPRTPFQTLTPPPAPQYGARGAWILWPSSLGEGAADIFYIHSTTYYSRNHWNAPLSDDQAEETLRVTAAPNEAGPFLRLGAVFGPRYRQATLFSFFTHKYDGIAARQAAFADVDEAFSEFLKQSTDPERPIMLVGYGQGGLHALGLLQRYFNKDKLLRNRLAAAYVIGHTAPPEFFSSYAPNLRACKSAEDYRCVISYVALEQKFDEEMRRARIRNMTWNTNGDLVPASGRPPLCINPLTWTAAQDYVEAENHLGAASATGLKLGDLPTPVARAVGAKCDRGVLVVDSPRQEFLRRSNWFGAKWKAQNFNLFYHDLAVDAARRIALTQAKMTEEATILRPITDAVDLNDSPVNKVPD